MQRFRPGFTLQLAKSGSLAQAVSPLPGLYQLAAPTLYAVTAAIPPTLCEARPVTNFVSLRSFAAAAEPCRAEDPQSAAEALFKVSDERPPAVYQPVAFPFFARAYYVGTTQQSAQKMPVRACSLRVLTPGVLPAGNSINVSQLNKRAQKLGYHTQVGKGMVLMCAAANTKGKLTEHGTVTVSYHSPLNICANCALQANGLQQLHHCIILLRHHLCSGVGAAP